MNIGGLDIASTTGLCVLHGDEFRASTFKPRAKRPFELAKGAVSFEHEGQMAREFRDHLRPWLIDNKIEHVAIEMPLTPLISVKKPVIDLQANFHGQALRFEEKGGTTFGTIFRIYMLVGQAVELTERLNIKAHVVPQGEWRQAFLGVRGAPRGTTNGSEWLKKRALAQCQQLKIDVPNLDAAEAVGLVWWLRGRLNPRLAGLANDLFRQKVVRA